MRWHPFKAPVIALVASCAIPGGSGYPGPGASITSWTTFFTTARTPLFRTAVAIRRLIALADWLPSSMVGWVTTYAVARSMASRSDSMSACTPGTLTGPAPGAAASLAP